MADFARKHVSPYNSPTFNYDVSYVQTSRGDGRASYKVTVTAYMSTAYDYFGYYLDATVTIGNSSQTIRLKENSPTWSGTGRHSYEFYLNPTGLTNSSGTVSCYLRVKSNSGASGRYNDSATINYDTVTLSSYNTAPTISGSVKYNVSNNFNEKTSSITINGWSYRDAENNIAKIKVHRWINGVSNGSWDISPTTTFTDSTVGNYGEGTKFEYGVQAIDGYGLSSGVLWGSPIYKNRFTPATLSGGSAISYSTSSLDFTWSGASNTSGNTSFNYSLECEGITIYRNTTTGTSMNVAIVDVAPSSGAYILRSDIVNKFKSSNYNGTLTFYLYTTNFNGTKKSSTKALATDMRTAPKAPTLCVINKDKLVSTAIQDVNGTNYFLPEDGRVIKLEWNAGSDYLGGAVTYTVQRKLGAGSYVTIASDINRLYENVYLDKPATKQTLTFKVITKTSFGYTSEKTSDTVTIHYYNYPILSVGKIERTSNAAKVPITVQTETSLWSEMTVQTIGSWICDNGQIGTLSGSQTEQVIQLTGLEDNKNYLISLNYTDNTGLHPVLNREISIGENTPVAFVNKYGLGVGGFKATPFSAFAVKGNATVTGMQTITQDLYVHWNLNTQLEANIGTNLKVGGNAVVNGQTTFGGTVNFNKNVDHRGSMRINKEFNDGQGYYHYSNGFLVTTNLSKNTNTMFELYITGNSYGTQYPIDIKINGYIYNQGFTNLSCFCNAYNVPIDAFFNSEDKLCFWFKQAGNYTTFRFKLCTTFGQDYPSYIVTNSTKPSAITVDTRITTHQGYNSKNSWVIVEKGGAWNNGYVRFSDGTQICYKRVEQGCSNFNAWGSIWESYAFGLGTWPASFLAGTTPIVNVQCGQGTFYAWVTTCHSTTTTNIGTISLARPTNATNVTAVLYVIGIGRWK